MLNDLSPSPFHSSPIKGEVKRKGPIIWAERGRKSIGVYCREIVTQGILRQEGDFVTFWVGWCIMTGK